MKISFLTKFTFQKSQFSQNSHSQNLIFDKIHIFFKKNHNFLKIHVLKISFLTKFTSIYPFSQYWQNSHFLSIKFQGIFCGKKRLILLQCSKMQSKYSILSTYSRSMVLRHPSLPMFRRQRSIPRYPRRLRVLTRRQVCEMSSCEMDQKHLPRQCATGNVKPF